MARRRTAVRKRVRSVRRARPVARRKSGMRKASRRTSGVGRTLRIVIEHAGVDNAARPELASPRQTHVRTAKF